MGSVWPGEGGGGWQPLLPEVARPTNPRTSVLFQAISSEFLVEEE